MTYTLRSVEQDGTITCLESALSQMRDEAA